MSNNVTIADIAAKAGVSKAAAWAALSDRRTSIVLSDATRKNIVKLAREMNYQPNLTARGLANQQSYLISFLCRGDFNNDATGLLLGMQDVLLEKGYSVIVYTHGDTVEDELGNINHSVARQAQAVMVAPAIEANGRTNGEKFLEMQKSGTPVVQLFNGIIPNVPTVFADNYEAGKFAVNYLIERGHRRIAHYTYDTYKKELSFPTELKLRWKGYEDAMLEAGLEPIVFTSGELVPFSRAGQEIAREMTNHPYCPSAVITYSDPLAIALRNSLLKAGIRVPQDISIIGYGGLEIKVPGLDANLATFLKPLRQIGRQAAQLCLRMNNGKSVEDVTCQCEFKPGTSVATLKNTL